MIYTQIKRKSSMPKWKKDETEFSVSLGYQEVKGYWITVPKPIVQLLGTPKKVIFKLKGKRIEVEGSNED
jgi:hypothetical protein